MELAGEWACTEEQDGYAHSFEVGNPKIICGHSGTELVYEVLRKIGIEMEFPKPQVEYDYSPEYWSG